MQTDFIKKRFSGDWSRKDIAITLWAMAMFYVRGSLKRIFFKRSRGIVLAGKGVSIRYSHYLETGKDFIIEDYAEINC